MLPVFVRSSAPDGASVDEAVLPTDLGEGGTELRAETLVARRREGPFLPFFQALREDPALRANFARALQLRALRRLRPWRTWLLAGLVPLLVVVELERELWSAHVAPVGARLFTDLFACVYVAADLVRPVPRHPRACALLLFAVTARYLYMIAAARGHGLSVMMWGAPAVALAAGVGAWVLVPTRGALVASVLARFHLHAPDAPRAKVPRAIPRALAAAIGVPAALLVTRAIGGNLWVQAGVFLVAGGLAAWFGRAPEAKTDGGPTWDRRSRGFRMAEAVALGLAVTLGLAGLAHYLVNAGAQVLQVTQPELYERAVSRFLQAETTETSRQIEGVRTRYAFVFMSTLAGPILEELVYRHALQRALRDRFGVVRAIAMTAAVFALAHVGVYRAALYQTVLLGIGFGVAYEEGGILAAICVHVVWNAYLLL